MIVLQSMNGPAPAGEDQDGSAAFQREIHALIDARVGAGVDVNGAVRALIGALVSMHVHVRGAGALSQLPAILREVADALDLRERAAGGHG